MSRRVLLLGGVPLLLGGVPLLVTAGSHALPPSKSQTEKVEQAAHETTRNEALKESIRKLDLLGRLQNPALAREAKAELLASLDDLPASVAKRLVMDVEKMDAKSLLRLAKKEGGSSLASYAQALGRGSGGGLAYAKSVVAGGGDDAGLAAIGLLRRLEDGAGALPKDEVVDVLKKLDPERAKAFLGALAGEAEKSATKNAAKSLRAGAIESLGTLVEGVFVFNDAVNIYYSEDPPEEKAAAATGKAVEYGAGTAANVAVASLGGGLAPAIVVGWSAAQVGEMTREAIGLYHDRQNAELKEQWQRIELRQLAIEQMLRINELMRAGKLEEAGAHLRKLRGWVREREDEMSTEGLGERLISLDGKLDEAHEKYGAEGVLREARLPYDRALGRLRKGRDLTLALSEAKECQQVLADALPSYQEHLAGASARASRLVEAIESAIQAAKPLQIDRVVPPRGVAMGDWAQIVVYPSGGIPAYVDASGSSHVGSYSSVTVYWQAPSELGEREVELRIRDDLGQSAVATTKLNVLPPGVDPDLGPPEQGVMFGGVRTEKVYADFHDVFEITDGDVVRKRTTYHATVSFWNVGSMLPGYGGVTVQYVERSEAGEERDTATGTFTGGPNGTFTIGAGAKGAIPAGTARMTGGQQIAFSGDDGSLTLTVRPTQAFAVWPPSFSEADAEPAVDANGSGNISAGSPSRE